MGVWVGGEQYRPPVVANDRLAVDVHAVHVTEEVGDTSLESQLVSVNIVVVREHLNPYLARVLADSEAIGDRNRGIVHRTHVHRQG